MIYLNYYLYKFITFKFMVIFSLLVPRKKLGGSEVIDFLFRHFVCSSSNTNQILVSDPEPK